MSNPEIITRHDLIRLIGDVLTEIDVLSSNFDPDTKDRDAFDEQRDKLDTAQRRLVHSTINENTKELKDISASLKAVNETLSRTSSDIGKIATTFESLVNLVNVIQKIVELVP